MDPGLALILAASIPSLVTAIFSLYASRALKGVKNEVRTLNESTMGQLAAAGETRRIEDIPLDERTAKEQRHMQSAPPQGDDS